MLESPSLLNDAYLQTSQMGKNTTTYARETIKRITPRLGYELARSDPYFAINNQDTTQPPTETNAAVFRKQLDPVIVSFEGAD
mmetsp:Transcript_3094/g.6327  ORF Transcript_3094/g.6327 Transcript_3094/m.6327 type:complete len:83 (-) Transcript_3094:165-413(-)